MNTAFSPLWQELIDCIDFLSPQTRYRLRHANRKQELLARAVGIKGSRLPTVVDTTAGLGQDALLLAALGCRVMMLERCRPIAARLRQCLKEAEKDLEIGSIISRITLIEKDSIDWLSKLNGEITFDVLYLDPMFPSRQKRALVKKSMQLLQLLLDDEPSNAATLLEAAIACSPKRVVMKCPLHANKTLPHLVPTFSLKGRSCRFDVFCC